MIDHDEFSAMRAQMEREDTTRERIIKQSRDVLKASKQAIYSLHRTDIQAAKRDLDAAEKAARALLPETKAHPHLRSGALSSALEEYAEARALLVFLEEGRLATREEMGFVDTEEYLLGLCDLTGELGRHAVHRATARDLAAVRKVRDLMDALMGELLGFDFRNSELRRKYDSVKYALQKVEQLLYELEMKEGGR